MNAIPCAAILVLALLPSTGPSRQTAPPGLGACGGETRTFKDVRLPQGVLADGKPLAAGLYEVRVTTEHPSPARGQSPTGECWVEFVKDGAVAGREVASVVPPEEIAAVAKGPAPKPGTTRVDLLKEGEYLRVWINSAGTHYLINLTVSPKP
jgi:hypothetical protein